MWGDLSVNNIRSTWLTNSVKMNEELVGSARVLFVTQASDPDVLGHEPKSLGAIILCLGSDA